MTTPKRYDRSTNWEPTRRTEMLNTKPHLETKDKIKQLLKIWMG